MPLSLSTRWNAQKHKTGEAMIDEVLALGFTHVELGYDLTIDLAQGVQKMVAEGSVKVDSVHNFCPLPVGIVYASPEVFVMASLDRAVRDAAVRHTTQTIRFAAEVGARCVVVHAGRVEMSISSGELVELYELGLQYDARYEKKKIKLLEQRDKKVSRHMDLLCEGIEQLMPVLEQTGVTLALENLPSWEALPCESEMVALLGRFDSPRLGYWHDMGHGQVRQNLGFINHRRWLERLMPSLVGVHIHDALPPAADHLMPGKGSIDFGMFKDIVKTDAVLVLEPFPGTPDADIIDGVKVIEAAWNVKQAGG